MAAEISFTMKRLAALPVEAKPYYVRDSDVRGLVLAVQPSGNKLFQVVRKLHGKTKRVSLGRYPELSVANARRQAQRIISTMIDGVDPNRQRRAQRQRGVTLEQALADYLASRQLRPNTVAAYHTMINNHLADWKKKPLRDLTREMITTRHAKIATFSATSANKTMRVVRALFNFAREEYLGEDGKPVFTDNPVGALSHRRQWQKETRRTDRIRASELAAWWAATEVEDPTRRDYLRLVLLTGLRRREASGLRWADIDFEERTLTVHDTKNGTAHTLPLSTLLLQLLQVRCAMTGDSPYVFPGDGRLGYLAEPRKAVARVAQRSGVEVTVHGLRRTFISIAESLDIAGYTLKALLNHKVSSDVTQGYLVLEVERLREPMERISNYICDSIKNGYPI